MEAAYGVNVLKYTETVQATSGASLASEILRGLGYWYFYGTDRLGPWTQASVAYTQNLWLVGASFAVPLLPSSPPCSSAGGTGPTSSSSSWSAWCWPSGPTPTRIPSVVGTVIKTFHVDTTAGLALRSTDRASPLVILGLAMLLGAGVTAVAARVRKTGLVIGGLRRGRRGRGATVRCGPGPSSPTASPSRPPPPRYVTQAAVALDTTHPGTRVYALPGNNFAAYRWGDTIDTVYPGLLTRPS